MVDAAKPDGQAPAGQPKLSGFRVALRYTGIPPSWLDKRPKLPSRNWLIFLSVTSSITGWYIYDRRQCKKIKQEYIDKVKDLSEVPSNPLDPPRKVTVYGAKWPNDEDYEQGVKYFRKYVKPILVAAAVDYEMISGKRHGEIARRISEEVRKRRRLDAGVDQVPEVTKALPTYKPLPELRKYELEGGIIIVGRQTFKEVMAGLKNGWTDGLQRVDHEELLAQELADDGQFDEEDGFEGELASPKTMPKLAHLSTPAFAGLNMSRPPPRPGQQMKEPLITEAIDPPSSIPPIPPLLLVPFIDYIGFTQIPLMIWDFFNQRHKFQSGAESAYRLIMGQTRPILPPSDVDPVEGTPTQTETGDLSFDKQAEQYYKKSLDNFSSNVEKERKKYYDDLSGKLKTARELARGTRELTKDEENRPPPTEVELRAERLKKEQRWRNDLQGWDIVKPSQPVVWDDRFRDSIRIFVDPKDGVLSDDYPTHSS
ncbi:hypothetical protein BDN72DRAFT_808764 [Pluteus cervinus]|uniref:Uncharacterized protein n=1 Tax=Pluteus cervinus TaxID=181527 RepID=A0ACD3BE19_9AGAR|nr:hypothetical protein BDN72DRAFT_808764 [Pluteus cervinus]